MKKEIIKKISIVSLIGLSLSSSTYISHAYTLNNDSNISYMKLSNNENENLDIHNKFKEIFPDEMKKIDNLVRKNRSANKTEEQFLNETKNENPIIDTEKEVNGEYYRLIAFSNGTYYKLGVEGGTSSTGSGYVSYKKRKVFGQFASPAINTVSGHTFTGVISYTNVKGGYDYIDVANPYSFYYCKNAYTSENKKLKEDSKGNAYVTFHYDGRYSYLNGQGSIYAPFKFTVYVGNDTIKLSAGVR